MTRTSTPDVKNSDGSTTITTKRACNGCGEAVGDITEAEIRAAISGAPLPDVRPECPNCRAEHPVAECRPMRLIVGTGDCLERECEEYATEDGDDSGIDQCSHLQEGVYCVEHSTEHEDGTVDPAEPWPCQYDTTRTDVPAEAAR